jgi:holliday junction DNA helicase RuvA
MYEFIRGKIVELTPAFAVIESNGMGYFINISVSSYSQMHGKQEVTLFLHLAVREDAHVLFGFASKMERELFRMLISVSGIGPNTARMVLSSLPPNEIQNAIHEGNVNVLQSVKGIGTKSAQRIIVDLKDKIGISSDEQQNFASLNNTLKIEALSAMEVLGFNKKTAEKVLEKLILTNPDSTVEDLIKKALKVL